MKKNIFMIRHGETDWNLQERVQGWSDIPLNKNGEKQAFELSQKINQLPIEVIYSSDLKRTIKTVEILNRKLNLRVNTDSSLRETNFGDAEGLTRDEKNEKYADLMQQINDMTNPDRDNVKIPGGESRNDVIKRFHNGVYKICCKETTNNILLCIHRSLMNTLSLIYLGEMFDFDNCSCMGAVFDTQTKKFSEIKIIQL